MEVINRHWDRLRYIPPSPSRRLHCTTFLFLHPNQVVEIRLVSQLGRLGSALVMSNSRR
jgi:hypothetical protein